MYMLHKQEVKYKYAYSKSKKYIVMNAVIHTAECDTTPTWILFIILKLYIYITAIYNDVLCCTVRQVPVLFLPLK